LFDLAHPHGACFKEDSTNIKLKKVIAARNKAFFRTADFPNIK
jgi:hypothetical protein